MITLRMDEWRLPKLNPPTEAVTFLSGYKKALGIITAESVSYTPVSRSVSFSTSSSLLVCQL